MRVPEEPVLCFAWLRDRMGKSSGERQYTVLEVPVGLQLRQSLEEAITCEGMH